MKRVYQNPTQTLEAYVDEGEKHLGGVYQAFGELISGRQVLE